jgi:hypothetical protein
MATVLFISEETLKQETIISENVDPKLLVPTIKEAQNIYLLPILGTSLYNQLVTQVSSNTVSAANITLLDTYITPTLVKYCIYESILPLSFKFQNKNIATKNSEFSNQASMEDLRYLLDYTKNRAEWYAERLSNFLLANTSTYPLYLTQQNANIDTIYPNSNNYQNGMYLGPDIDWDLVPPSVKYQGNFRRKT